MSQDNLLVRTETSSYLIHRSSTPFWVIRNPDDEALHPSEGSTVVSTLRKDNEQIPLLEMNDPTVGESLRLVLDIRGDGVSTFRLTTPVQEVTVIL